MVDKLDTFREEASQQQCDNKFELIKQSHLLQELKYETQLNTQQVSKQEKIFASKSETELLREELQNLMMGSHAANSEYYNSGEDDDAQKTKQAAPI